MVKVKRARLQTGIVFVMYVCSYQQQCMMVNGGLSYIPSLHHHHPVYLSKPLFQKSESKLGPAKLILDLVFLLCVWALSSNLDFQII